MSLSVQGDHNVDEPVESSVPGRKASGGVHGYVGHEERRGETQTISEHSLVNVPRQLILSRQDVHDVLTIIGRGRQFLRFCGSRLPGFKKGVRRAMRSDDLHSP